MICPNCGYENQEEAKFCGKCGCGLTGQVERGKAAAAEEVNRAAAQTAHMTILKDPVTPAIRIPGGKKTKLGRIVFPLLAAAGLAAGFFVGRSIVPKENPVTRMINYDTYTLSMAAGFTYDGVTDKGTVEILGPQGTPLCQIAGVRDNSFRILDQSSMIIYLDTEEQLCEQHIPKGEKNILAKKGNWDTVWVSDDGGYVTYADQVNGLTETMVYDLAEGKPKRLTDGIVKDQYMDADDKSLYYLDESGALYQYKGLTDKNRIKGDVTGYRILSGEPAVFWQSWDGGEAAFGVKWGEEENRLNGFRSITNVAIENSSQLILVQGCEEDELSDSLYVIVKGQEPVKAYSDVAEFFCADNLNLLYYRTADGTLYSIRLPVFEGETTADSVKLKAAVKALEKQKLSSDAKQMSVSPNGEHLAWISSDGELHYRHFQADKDLVLGEEMKRVRTFDQSVYAVGEDGQMIRCVYSGGEAVNVKNIREGSAGTTRRPTYYGDSLAVADEKTGTLQVLDRANGLATLVPDMTAYDKVTVQGVTIYEKTMDYSQALGSYRLNEEGVILTLKEDHTLGVYEIPDYTQPLSNAGEERSVTIDPKGVTKFRLDLGAREDVAGESGQELLTSTSAIILEDGKNWYWKTSEEAEPISMERMTEGKIQTLTRGITVSMNYEAEALERSQYYEAERKMAEERAEERRREEERKRQEEQQARNSLQQRAQSYYYNDIYLPANTYYYSSPNLYSRTGRYISSRMKKTVYSYQVDYSGYLIWLKVKGSDGNYYWVYVR